MAEPRPDICYGIASVSTVGGRPFVDHQGDTLTTAELERAAAAFMEKSRQAGIMHLRKADGSVVSAGRILAALFARIRGFDFHARYGELGAGFAEVRHKQPLAEAPRKG
jgi:hypothetical protein